MALATGKEGLHMDTIESLYYSSIVLAAIILVHIAIPIFLILLKKIQFKRLVVPYVVMLIGETLSIENFKYFIIALLSSMHYIYILYFLISALLCFALAFVPLCFTHIRKKKLSIPELLAISAYAALPIILVTLGGMLL